MLARADSPGASDITPNGRIMNRFCSVYLSGVRDDFFVICDFAPGWFVVYESLFALEDRGGEEIVYGDWQWFSSRSGSASAHACRYD